MPRQSTRVYFYGNVATCPNWVGCQQVARWVHLWISIQGMFLLFGNSILSKSCIPQPIFSFCTFCSVRNQLFLNLCVACNMLNFGLSRQSIVLLWTRISTRCHEYSIFQTKHWWHSIDAHFHDMVMYISRAVSVEKATITLYIHYYHKATLGLAKIQDQQ